MSRTITPGWMIGQGIEGRLEDSREYALKTNETLAGDNASPLPSGDVACVGFKLPATITKFTIEDGRSTAFRQAMTDQLDEEDKLSFARR